LGTFPYGKSSCGSASERLVANKTLLNILIVDDSDDDQVLMVTAFQRLGVTRKIDCVNGGYEAIAYIKGEGKFAERDKYPYPSFIITDLKMPDGDGFTLLEQLKSMPQYRIIPTVVMSASADEDDIKNAYMLGASIYLVKPPSFDELVRVLRMLVDLWLVAKLPAVDVTGKQLATRSCGKLGDRFSQSSEDLNPHASTPDAADAGLAGRLDESVRVDIHHGSRE
jgi:CheY-like chemotaxis protein